MRLIDMVGPGDDAPSPLSIFRRAMKEPSSQIGNLLGIDIPAALSTKGLLGMVVKWPLSKKVREAGSQFGHNAQTMGMYYEDYVKSLYDDPENVAYNRDAVVRYLNKTLAAGHDLGVIPDTASVGTAARSFLYNQPREKQRELAMSLYDFAQRVTGAERVPDAIARRAIPSVEWLKSGPTKRFHMVPGQSEAQIKALIESIYPPDKYMSFNLGNEWYVSGESR